MKKAIAMRCTKEQFKAIKPKLKKEGVRICKEVLVYLKHGYLTNFYNNVFKIKFTSKNPFNESEYFEEWNEKVFLEACGISTIPTLEEVKCLFDGQIWDITKSKIVSYRPEKYCAEPVGKGTYCRLWKLGDYAEILTYKEKTYSLTKEQLKSITDPQVKTWFPEVFETVLEVGKWYKTDWCGGSLFCVTELSEGNNATGYGMEANFGWQDIKHNYWELSKGFEPATESEVFEALKNEAVKRGFVCGAWFKGCAGNQKNEILQLDYFKFAAPGSGGFSTKNIGLYAAGDNSWIFNQGQWAEIIPTKTKTEAEKEFNCKIID